uniref:Uncharacterized protein n=1 Tax=Aureoumbra lagunensis TaxID=44058 RepID=A0A7S3NIS5_9STRA|mmetsp:Transcript_23457/g.30466  ORF Transcript_23457/g.30466 Transcript_23457/m.30466 type:complete len:301 (+) Transcript_23457:36-938(+)|eukprot:CAMPEP_0197315382 /NCGR_PEP_ID=MMETSP0891-20130614/37998_1 /TAXON_ID=44058 ORGANISM="Aureoumbra lagunensis, Strain CCMP1510" /NCGR_SAMPLE_ID=MMETSP0891 /ASSEMBLY_ACC=CAM_ASM_000534 /LENGTH=300 /DNA_ID=CAMNT_0042804303 /DNA_START=50 /DNA_END=952 /DNA_ORIENTATION=-
MEGEKAEERKLLPPTSSSCEEEEVPNDDLSIEKEGCWSFCLDDLAWAVRETHWMVMEYTTSAEYQKNTSYQEQRIDCYYNPLYHALVIVGAICLVLGAWIHSPFGQGREKVRADESKVEHEARTQWILMTSGPFAIAAFFDAIYLLFYNADVEIAIGLAVDSSYILGNVMFLEAMKRQSKPLTRLAIISNAIFALGLVMLLIGGIIFAANKHESNAWKIFDWFIRAITVVFFLLATLIYAQLWHAYDHVEYPNKSPTSCAISSSDFFMGLLIAGAALFIWFLFVFAVFLDGPKAIWAAVA